MHEITNRPKTVDFRFTAHLEAGFMFPIAHIINKIKALAFSCNVECQVLKSGWWRKRVEFLFHGQTTMEVYEKFKLDLDDYFQRVNRAI